MFVITFVGSIALATPIQAHAKIVAYQNGQPITWAGKKGNVIIGECTTKLMTGSVDGDGDQLFRLTMPDGSTIDAFCRNKENAAPANAKYYFAAFPSDGLDQEDMNNLYNNRESNRRHNLRIDLNQEDIKCRGEKGSYVIYVDTSGAISPPGFRVSPDGKKRYKYPPAQRLKFESWRPRLAAPIITKGKITLKKVSANPDITDGNSAYSLAGAVFGVYRDQACTNEATTLTTDASGNAVSGELDAGQYWIKEQLCQEDLT